MVLICNISKSLSGLYKSRILLLVLAMEVFFIRPAEAIHSQPMAISVFAGNDRTICANENLNLSLLGASITGDVTDGTWFSMGNGTFSPCGIASCTFSVAQTYVPGSQDIYNGGVDLMLVSFDPDGPGPLGQVIDIVHITLQSQPPMACVSNINVSLGSSCTQLIVPQMLVANPVQPYGNYIITLYDENGVIIPNNLLTAAHLNTLVQFVVGHACGTNTCEGYINVQDKSAPTLLCKNYSILCSDNSSPLALGLPIPPTATATQTGPFSFVVSNFDACSNVILTYQDVVTNFNCSTSNGLLQRINRTWVATDANGNSSTCFEVIKINALSLNAVSLPQHYDGVQKPALECDGPWPALPNGHPNPSYTGYPVTGGCSNIDYTYTDDEFDICGNAKKILRKWLIIDWCTSQVMEYNQIIKILDTTKPFIVCPAPITLSTSSYQCMTGLEILPALDSIYDCSLTTTTVKILSSQGGVDFTSLVVYSNGLIMVNNLPQGNYNITYTATDECLNKSSCISTITVVDDKVPIAVCDQFTKVSIGTSGTGRVLAESLDDGSIDNCGIASYKIAKMTNICPGGNLQFGSYADFCCLEVSDTIQVAMRVTDIFGNSNSCMVNIIVEDKLPPVIYCPSSFTISCDYSSDWSDLSDFGDVVSSPSLVQPITINGQTLGYDGYFIDNCSGVITSTSIQNLTCNQGTIQRTFKVMDNFNNNATCVQTITVVDYDPFALEDISFPQNIDINGCLPSQATTDITGSPTYVNTGCSLVSSSYVDQIFQYSDGVCIKILRFWTVIDWCQYNQSTGQGVFTYIQVIKLQNTVLPVITSMCKDTTLCLYEQNCGNGPFDFVLTATDDCTPDSLLTWTWDIDIDSDGDVDVTGTSALVSASLPIGNHVLTYTVKDKCGNTRTCEMDIHAIDCKRPTPYCYGAITTVLMPTSGSIAVHASQFDLGSFDNCTPQSQLKFSFTTAIKDSVKLFTCSDIPNGIAGTISLKMWVIDKSGNSDFCLVELMLQDNNNVCTDIFQTASIQGKIATEALKAVTKVDVHINSPVAEFTKVVKTDSTGAYLAKDLPISSPFVIKPLKSEAVDRGLSTLDLVKIQRHLLNLEKFTSPYKILASDADGNKKINVSDLVYFRKIILGKTQKFPANVKEWVFVDKSFSFPDVSNPWMFPDSTIIPSLDLNNGTINFIGIKRGDVNGSYVPSLILGESEPRSVVEFTSKTEGNLTTISSPGDIEVFGFQMEFEAMNDVELIDLNPSLEASFDWNVIDQKFRLLCYSGQPIHLGKGEELFTLKSIGGLTSMFDQEMYPSSDEIIKVRLISKNENAETNQSDALARIIYEHPFVQIIADENIPILDYFFIDMNGRTLLSGKLNSDAQIDCKNLPFGVYIIKLISGNRSQVQKLILGGI